MWLLAFYISGFLLLLLCFYHISYCLLPLPIFLPELSFHSNSLPDLSSFVCVTLLSVCHVYFTWTCTCFTLTFCHSSLYVTPYIEQILLFLSLTLHLWLINHWWCCLAWFMCFMLLWKPHLHGLNKLWPFNLSTILPTSIKHWPLPLNTYILWSEKPSIPTHTYFGTLYYRLLTRHSLL